MTSFSQRDALSIWNHIALATHELTEATTSKLIKITIKLITIAIKLITIAIKLITKTIKLITTKPEV